MHPRLARHRKLAQFGVSTLALAMLTACASDTTNQTENPAPAPSESASASPSASASTGTVTGDLTVLAAASLTEVFQKLATTFQSENPGVHVTFSFGGSSTLAQQIIAKAPADVFAAASPTTMKTVTDAGDAAGSPQLFVRNVLEIATPPNNPGNISGLSDFGKSSLKIAVCAVALPCGAAADKVFKASGLSPEIDSYEQDVKGVLTKVESGEADAGLVYRTDVKSAGDKVKGIDFPEASNAINDYPIASLTEAKNPTAANAWIAFLLSQEARQVFTDFGFQLP
jgi:molybdate transport system substrate-binding protein